MEVVRSRQAMLGTGAVWPSVRAVTKQSAARTCCAREFQLPWFARKLDFYTDVIFMEFLLLDFP